MVEFKTGEFARIRNDVPNHYVRNVLVKIVSDSKEGIFDKDCHTVEVKFPDNIFKGHIFSIFTDALTKFGLGEREEIE
jgi:hypothetical protein